MNKYSPHEAFGKNSGLSGGGTPSVYRGPVHSMPSPEKFGYGSLMGIVTKPFHRWPNPKVKEFDTLDLHVKGAPRPRKGIIPPCSGVRPYITLFCPTQRTTGAKEGVNYACSRTTRPPQP